VRKINTLLNSSDKTSITEQKDFEKSFLIKADLVVDSIRLFARLIILELRNVFPAVAVRALLELLTKSKKLKHLF